MRKDGKLTDNSYHVYSDVFIYIVQENVDNLVDINDKKTERK